MIGWWLSVRVLIVFVKVFAIVQARFGAFKGLWFS